MTLHREEQLINALYKELIKELYALSRARSFHSKNMCTTAVKDNEKALNDMLRRRNHGYQIKVPEEYYENSSIFNSSYLKFK
jgi:hypothetical protein